VKHQCVAVIGGTGFVGTHVLKLLKDRGIPCVNVDRLGHQDQAVETRIADLRDRPALTAALAGCDVAIFLAAEWRDDVRPESLYYEVNVDGAANFAAAAQSVGLNKCIFTSSVSVYGPTEYEVEEDFAPNPINHYGKSKLLAEAKLKAWANDNPENTMVVIRPTVIFGKGNRGNVWNLLSQMANGPFVMIGDGSNRKSVAYVENIAAFIVSQLGAAPGYQVYNYADKPDYDMNTLVALINDEMERAPTKGPRIPQVFATLAARGFDVISRITGRRFGITAERVFKFCANTQYSSTKAMNSGFTPPVALEDALRETIRIEFKK
jgi:nucleoside-diphosphate-sugar epimerase